MSNFYIVFSLTMRAVSVTFMNHCCVRRKRDAFFQGQYSWSFLYSVQILSFTEDLPNPLNNHLASSSEEVVQKCSKINSSEKFYKFTGKHP